MTANGRAFPLPNGDLILSNSTVRDRSLPYRYPIDWARHPIHRPQHRFTIAAPSHIGFSLGIRIPICLAAKTA
jgi:hypothetical protein